MANSNVKLESECEECKVKKKRTLGLILLGHEFGKTICIADSPALTGVLDWTK